MAKEYIEKAAVREWFRPYGHTDEPIPYEAITEFLDTEPAADVVEVVRCGECKFCKNHPTSNRVRMCTNKGWNREYYPLVTDTEFCSKGERRVNNAAD